MKKTFWIAAAACLVGCAEIEHDSPMTDDSLAVIPVEPGRDSGAFLTPDTLPAPPDTGAR